MAENGVADVPLSPEAQDAKESMQRQLLRTMASKMYAAAQEEERARRIKEMESADDDQVKKLSTHESWLLGQFGRNQKFYPSKVPPLW